MGNVGLCIKISSPGRANALITHEMISVSPAPQTTSSSETSNKPATLHRSSAEVHSGYLLSEPRSSEIARAAAGEGPKGFSPEPSLTTSEGETPNSDATS